MRSQLFQQNKTNPKKKQQQNANILHISQFSSLYSIAYLFTMIIIIEVVVVVIVIVVILNKKHK